MGISVPKVPGPPLCSGPWSPQACRHAGLSPRRVLGARLCARHSAGPRAVPRLWGPGGCSALRGARSARVGYSASATSGECPGIPRPRGLGCPLPTVPEVLQLAWHLRGDIPCPSWGCGWKTTKVGPLAVMGGHTGGGCQVWLALERRAAGTDPGELAPYRIHRAGSCLLVTPAPPLSEGDIWGSAPAADCPGTRFCRDLSFREAACVMWIVQRV